MNRQNKLNQKRQTNNSNKSKTKQKLRCMRKKMKGNDLFNVEGLPPPFAQNEQTLPRTSRRVSLDHLSRDTHTQHLPTWLPLLLEVTGPDRHVTNDVILLIQQANLIETFKKGKETTLLKFIFP